MIRVDSKLHEVLRRIVHARPMHPDGWRPIRGLPPLAVAQLRQFGLIETLNFVGEFLNVRPTLAGLETAREEPAPSARTQRPRQGGVLDAIMRVLPGVAQ